MVIDVFSYEESLAILLVPISLSEGKPLEVKRQRVRVRNFMNTREKLSRDFAAYDWNFDITAFNLI